MIIILSYDLAFSVDDANSPVSMKSSRDQYFLLIPLYDKCGLDLFTQKKTLLSLSRFLSLFKKWKIDCGEFILT